MANRDDGYLLSYVDFLFYLIGVLMVMLALIIGMVKVVNESKGNVVEKTEFVVAMEWDDNSSDDVDLWVTDPAGGLVFFRQRQVNLMTLDRDDLGKDTDSMMIDGEVKVVRINREVVTLRGIASGEYVVNAHMYSKRDVGQTKVKLRVVKLNPYSEVWSGETVFEVTGNEFTFVRFILDATGKVTSVNTLPAESLVQRVAEHNR